MKKGIVIFILAVMFCLASCSTLVDLPVEKVVVEEAQEVREKVSEIPLSESLRLEMEQAQYDISVREKLIKKFFSFQIELIVAFFNGEIGKAKADEYWIYCQTCIDELFTMYQSLDIL